MNLISCACLWSCHIIGLRIVFHVTQETITTFSFLCRYPANQVGSLIGLQSLTAAVTALLQYPIFVLIERVLGNDPFYVDLVLLGLSIFCFALPIFMFTRSRNMRRDQIREENEPDQQTLLSRPSQIIAPQLTSVPEDDVFAPNGGFNSV